MTKDDKLSAQIQKLNLRLFDLFMDLGELAQDLCRHDFDLTHEDGTKFCSKCNMPKPDPTPQRPLGGIK